MEFSLNVFTAFSDKNTCHYSKRAQTYHPATFCVRDQDATIVPARHMWETGYLNWAQLILQWFIRFPEFTEFTEFNESSASFRKNSIYTLQMHFKQISRTSVFTHWLPLTMAHWQIVHFSEIHKQRVWLISNTVYTVRNSSCGKILFLQVSVCPQARVDAWQGACVAGGACMAGGMHGRGCAWWGCAWQGVYMVGVCMAECMCCRGACMAGGMCGRGACIAGGMHGRGVCMAGGQAWQRGHAWQGCVCGKRACMTGDTHGRRDGHASYLNAF